MTGEQLKAIRHKLGLSLTDFACALGYAGNANTCKVQVRELERGKKSIEPRIAERALELENRHKTSSRLGN